MISLKGKKILVTGINGFIGVHLAKRLKEEGAHVEGIVRNKENIPYIRAAGLEKKFPLYELDIRNDVLLSDILNKGNYDVIFHLASQSDTWKSIHTPNVTIQTNVEGTLHVLEAVRKLPKRPKLVLAGTVRAFYDQSPTSENGALHPYDASKMAMETIALSYFHAYRIPGAIAKNTNVYGGNDLNFSRLIPLLMKQVFTEKSIHIKGDGQLKRDFMYVGDAVEGMIVLAEKLDDPSFHGKSVVFATGKQHSIREVCEEIQRQLAPQKMLVQYDSNNSLLERNQPILDVTKTKKELQWESRLSFEKGIKETIEWYRHYFEEKNK